MQVDLAQEEISCPMRTTTKCTAVTIVTQPLAVYSAITRSYTYFISNTTTQGPHSPPPPHPRGVITDCYLRESPGVRPVNKFKTGIPRIDNTTYRQTGKVSYVWAQGVLFKLTMWLNGQWCLQDGEVTGLVWANDLKRATVTDTRFNFSFFGDTSCVR